MTARSSLGELCPLLVDVDWHCQTFLIAQLKEATRRGAMERKDKTVKLKLKWKIGNKRKSWRRNEMKSRKEVVMKNDGKKLRVNE